MSICIYIIYNLDMYICFLYIHTDIHVYAIYIYIYTNNHLFLSEPNQISVIKPGMKLSRASEILQQDACSKMPGSLTGTFRVRSHSGKPLRRAPKRRFRKCSLAKELSKKLAGLGAKWAMFVRSSPVSRPTPCHLGQSQA